MQIIPIKTPIITANSTRLYDLVDQSIDQLQDGDVLAISSKIIALCENAVQLAEDDHKSQIDRLSAEQSDYFLPSTYGKYGYHFTITRGTMVATAGIDASNGDKHLVSWPKDPQASANDLWVHLRERYGLQKVGVIVTDSVSQPLRLGTIGAAIAHCGFQSLNDYRGKPDLFDRPLQYVRSNIASGLAAAATVAMGEGNEQTPLCLIRNVPAISFQDRTPTAEELNEIHLSIEDDLFAPFLTSAPWQKGGRSSTT